MAIKASPEAIRDMKKSIQNSIKHIERMSNSIKSGVASSNWNDAQSTQFNLTMQKIARLTATPVDTLKAALPKLEKLAQSLEQYNKVSWNK